MSLVLTNGPSGRRAGLSNKAQVASLLRSANASAIQNQAMPSRVVTKRGAAGVKAEALAKEEPEEEDEEYLNRPPDSSDDEVNSGNIESTDFRSTSEQLQEEKRQDTGTTKRGKKGIAIATSTTSTITKSRRGKLSQASSPSHDSPKRKSQEEVKTLGTGMIDEWGMIKVKKTKTGRKSTYGGRNASNTAPVIKHDLNTVSPKKAFKSVRKYDSSEESDAEEGNGFKRPNVAVDDSPATTPRSVKKFKPYTRTETPDPEESLPQPVFKKHRISFDDSFEESNLDDSQPSLPEKMHNTTVAETFPATQAPIFKAPAYDFDNDDALGTARSILEAESFRRPLASAPAIVPDDEDDEDDDTFQTMTQRARCPMCGESVDPADLRAFGRMNTRKQEKFCRSHRKTTALQIWDAEEYPTIDWGKLDSRISKHHSFIKRLINGADSHYRERLAETVNAGKNRSLLKSDYNPTPGYYGTRGLRAISENTMRKFTPLLKKRMVVDRLMAARGFTPYVEYVVVPEVAVKLIMEDMNCEEERAREIMSESLGVGELLSEEIKDVVRRTGSEEIEDSDE